MSKRWTLALAPLVAVAALALASPAYASGGSGAGGTATGGGGVKPPCTTALSVAATASQALTGNSFMATYALISCQSKTKVSLTATDIATGWVVYQSPDLLGTTAVWTLPYTLTAYAISARAYSGVTGATLATASTIVSTATALPCTPSINETVTTGYYGIYPAIWNATAAQNCLIPGTSTHIRITNRSTGLVEYETSSPIMSWMLDFEGPIVSYNTPYQVDADLIDNSGAILATSTSYATSAPLR